jgi:hypothetical protein
LQINQLKVKTPDFKDKVGVIKTEYNSRFFVSFRIIVFKALGLSNAEFKKSHTFSFSIDNVLSFICNVGVTNTVNKSNLPLTITAFKGLVLLKANISAKYICFLELINFSNLGNAS